MEIINQPNKSRSLNLCQQLHKPSDDIQEFEPLKRLQDEMESNLIGANMLINELEIISDRQN